MNCDLARRGLSAAADGEPDTEAPAPLVAEHVAGCPSCRTFGRDIHAIRRALRVDVIEGAPDVSGVVAARLRADDADDAGIDAAIHRGRGRRATLLASAVAVAAALVAGILVGGAVAKLVDRPRPAGAADLSQRALSAQGALDSLVARVTVIERGWRTAVPERRLVGTIAYRSPMHLALQLNDETAYPAGWQPNDLAVVSTGREWWTRGVRDCPHVPECTPVEPRVRSVVGTEPFDDRTPLPLELVVPVRSLHLSAPTELAHRRIEGRPSIGLATTAAQVQPLLDTLHLAGNLRHVHPTDPVELWLDSETLTAREVIVRAGGGEARTRWARARSHVETGEEEILRITLSALVVNGPVTDAEFPTAPPTASRVDLGHEADTDAAVGPVRLGPLRRTHAGRTSVPGGTPTTTTAWTDGRSYLVVRRTSSWPGRRLFGDLGPDVLVTDLGAAGTGYLALDRSRLAVHTATEDVVLFGSAGPELLRRAAIELDLVGIPIPHDWAEATSTTLAEARTIDPGLLLPPRPAGFAAPAVRVSSSVVALSYGGPGDRAFTLGQGPASTLPLPADPDVTAIAIRGLAGRYSPAIGRLEWLEGTRHVTIDSTTLAVSELLAIAEALE